MALDLKAMLSSTSNMIAKHKDTGSTYFTGSGLIKKVQVHFNGLSGLHEGIPVPLENYPAIFTELVDSDDAFIRLGSSARRDAEITFNIIAVTNYQGPGEGENVGRQKADAEVITLTQNINNLLRNNIRLSQTSVVSHSLVTGVDFSRRVDTKTATYNAMSTITLQVTAVNI